MKEIDKDFYCSGPSEKCVHYPDCEGINFLCESYHRKHPTPEQFKKEYGEDWAGAVYIKCALSGCTENCNKAWTLYPDEHEAIDDICTTGLENSDPFIVCACTPFGKPDGDWRPE
jgi:hypothetical protein